MKLFTICIAAVTIMLSGCNENQPTPVNNAQPTQLDSSNLSPTNQPQVVYQQQPEQEDTTIRDGLIGAGLGYMLGRHTAGAGIVGGNNGGNGYGSSGYSYQRPPTRVIQNNTTIVKKVYVQQAPRVSTSPRSYRSSFSSSSSRRR